MQLCLFSSGLREHGLLYSVIKCLLTLFRVEENVLISCACIPTLGPFFKFLQGKDMKSAFRAVSQYWRTRERSDHIALNDYDLHGKVDLDVKKSGMGQDAESLENLESGSRHQKGVSHFV